MKGTSGIFDFWHQKLGESPLAVHLAVKLRNQCNSVIRHCLMDGINPNQNGEYLLMDSAEASGIVFVDAGANVGDWSARVLATKKNVALGLLFDPSRSAIETLTKRFEDFPNVEVIPVALSDTVGTRRFFEEPNAGTTSSFVPGFSAPGAVATSATLTTLDHEARKRDLEQIDFLKIDVEGLDLSVLRGAASLLAHQKIHVVQFEYNKAWRLAGHTLAAAYRYLSDLGYSVYLLKARGLYELDYDKYGEYFGYSNFVAVRSSDKERFLALMRGPI